MKLLPYSDADFELTASLESDPAVMKDLGGPVPPDQIRHVHEKRLAGIATGDWYFVIVPDGATRPAGVIGIRQTPWEGGAIHELGVMLRPEHQRQRLGPAAAQMLIDRARAERAFPEIHALISVSNIASNEGCRHLGFQLRDQCDADYEGRPIRANHWVIDLSHLD